MRKITKKQLKYVKLFESFKQEELTRVLNDICLVYKENVTGGREHPSEFFNPEELVELSNKVDDVKIKDILKRVSEYTKEDEEGSIDDIGDYLSDADCHYICDYLGKPRMSFDEEDEDY